MNLHRLRQRLFVVMEWGWVIVVWFLVVMTMLEVLNMNDERNEVHETFQRMLREHDWVQLNPDLKLNLLAAFEAGAKFGLDKAFRAMREEGLIAPQPKEGDAHARQ